MTFRKTQTPTPLTLLFLVVGVLLVAVPALFVYLSATATVHSDPEAVPSVGPAVAAGRWSGAVEKARRIVRAALIEQNLPALSVAVGVGGDLVWAEGFGLADVEGRVPVTPESRFRIGTASAALTSAAVGLLVEEGRLRLDDPVRKYVPEFPEKPWPVTLRQVMAHTAGLPSDGGDESTLFTQHCARPVEALRRFANEDLLFEPGTRFRFSNYGWIVVSAAVEAAAGEPFLRFLQRKVFEPLGMADTLAESGERIPNRVSFYFPRFAADTTWGLHPMRPLDFSCYAGASVFLSTPSDLVRFGMALERGNLLRRTTLETLREPQRTAAGEETGYGLGWDLETVPLAGKPARVAGHNGALLGGMVSSLLTFAGHGLVVAVTSNISYADTFGVGVKIAEVFAADGQSRGTLP